MVLRVPYNFNEMRISLITHMLIFSMAGFCQDTLLYKKTVETLSEGDFGPNKKNYIHTFFKVGFYQNTDALNTCLIQGGNSFSLGYGVRFKRKLSSKLAFGYDLGYDFNQYRFKRDLSSLYSQLNGFLTADSLKTDKLTFGILELAPYFRINFGKRGDHLGKYLDFVFYGALMISSKHVLKWDHPNSSIIKKSTYKSRRLGYTNKLFYGIEMRYGNAFYNLFMRYRCVHIFNSKLNDNPYQPSLISWGAYIIIPD